MSVFYDFPAENLSKEVPRCWEFNPKDAIPFNSLKGEIFTNIFVNQDIGFLVFETEKSYYILEHWQECCEDVCLDDICGNLEDLLGVPILKAEETCGEVRRAENDTYEQYTFYHLATIKGYVTLRFDGNTNGYYSINASLYKGSKNKS